MLNISRPAWVAVVLAVALAARAQNTSALINETLDKLVQIEVDTTLPEAVKAITAKTGVPFIVTRAAYDALPWGEQTNLKTKISDQTLRASLTAITQTLGLKFSVADEAVLIEPQPALTRLGTRATVQDLNLLNALATNTLGGSAGDATVKQLLERIDTRLQELKLPYSIENRAGESLGTAAVQIPRDATLATALETVVAQSRATWYPWQNSVIVVPKEDHVRMLLDKQVTMRFAGVDVSQVLTELSRRSGVAITVEPGAVQRVPAESRTIKLVLENVSVRQALESISGFTGLGYVTNESGVYVWNTASAPARGRDRVVSIMTIDGVQVLLPESEIPPDVRQFLQQKRDKAIRELREQMKKEGFVPTSQPANDL
jgi:hypothetical protein